MQFKQSFATLAFALFASLNIAQSASLEQRAAQDVYVPRILTPNSCTIWTVGHVEQVTWDASDAPQNISNRALVTLRGVGTLVQDFDLRSGAVNVTVPTTVVPGRYTITLFGDGGNISPEFSIVAPSPSYS